MGAYFVRNDIVLRLCATATCVHFNIRLHTVNSDCSVESVVDGAAFNVHAGNVSHQMEMNRIP